MNRSRELRAPHERAPHERRLHRRQHSLLARLTLALLLFVLPVLIPRGAAHAQTATEESLISAKPTVVHFRGVNLFEIHAPSGTLQPRARARAIEARLGTIAGGSADALEQIHVVERERTSDLLAGEELVLSVSDSDAAPLGRTRQQLAADYAVSLTAVLEKEFSGRSLRGIAIAVAFTALATVVLLLLLRALTRVFARIAGRLRSWEGTRITALRLKDVELVSAAHMTMLASRVAVSLRWLLVAIALIVYLETVLGLFPWTRAAAVEARAYIIGVLVTLALAFVNYLPNLLYLAIIVVVVRLILKMSHLIFTAIGNGDLTLGQFQREWAAPSEKIVRFLIIAFAAVVSFPYLPGAGSPAFQGVSIFLGVLISFGSSSAVSNVVAGIVMTYMRPFHIGDRVQVGDTIGDIVEANLFNVRLRTIKNVDVTIPNATVLSGHIVNFSARAKDEGLIIHSTVTIGYDVPWRTVHDLLIGAATSTVGVAAEPKPFVLQTSLDDFYVSYQVNAYTDQAHRMAGLYGELHAHIQDAFAAAGLEIMSPHYRAVRDGAMITLPPDALPRGYVAPPLRVAMVGE